MTRKHGRNRAMYSPSRAYQSLLSSIHNSERKMDYLFENIFIFLKTIDRILNF
jgi:hypothetical protein